ncbi:MAG: DUF2534 family protein, partial [bacterium]
TRTMFCKNCGNTLPDNARFCTKCGVNQEVAAEPAGPAEPSAEQPPARSYHAPEPSAGTGAPPAGTIDGGRAFSYFTQDPGWLGKVLIGGLILLIPLVGTLILMGYQLRIIKNVADGRELPLPEWEIGEHLKNGFMLSLYCFGFALITTIPLWLVSIFIPIIGPLIGFVGNIAIGLYMITAVSIVGAEEDFGAIFQFKRIINILMNNLVPILLVFLFSIGAWIIGALGIIALIVGVFFTIIIAMFIYGHLLGQFYTIAHASEL